MSTWKLYVKDSDTPLQHGSHVITFRGELGILIAMYPPHKPSSSGKVEIELLESGHKGIYYAGVIGAEYRKED